MRYLLLEKVEVEDEEGYRHKIYPGVIPLQYVRQIQRCYGPETKLLEQIPDEE